jgi:putative protein kinase ArgK-like GTPase of G3E family
MLTLGTVGAARPEWVTPVIGVSSVTGEGIDELIDTLAQHRDVAFGTEFGRVGSWPSPASAAEDGGEPAA